MQRPVLRVQIPNDAKSNTNNSHSGVNNSDGKDTARTVTAVDNSATNQNTQSSNTTSGTGTADTNSSQLNSNGNSNLVPGNVPNTRFSGYSSFRSPDSRKPTLPLPLQTKSQTSSPASAVAPGLPLTGGSNAYFAGMQQSPVGGSYVNYPAQVYQQYQQFQNQLQLQEQHSNSNSNSNSKTTILSRSHHRNWLEIKMHNWNQQHDSVLVYLQGHNLIMVNKHQFQDCHHDTLMICSPSHLHQTFLHLKIGHRV